MTSTMPRIGYVLNTYPRLSETFILQEILELERRGVDVTIFSLKRPDEGKFHPGVVRVKAAVQYLDTLKPQRWWRWLQEEWETVQPHLPGLWRVIEEVVPTAAGATMDEVFLGMMVGSRARALGLDALHAHFANTSCNVAHFAHRTTGIPYSFTAHAKDIFTDTVDHAFLARKISDSRFMITVSEYNRQYLEEACPDADLSKIRVLYNGINLDFFAPGPVADSRSESLILGVGRLVAKKGFADLIRACGILRDRGLGYTCRIIGKGREEPRLNQLIAELNLTERVTLMGPGTQDEVRDMLRTADVLCQPCVRDSDGNQDALPTVLLEALASGTPVVSTRLAGIPEIISHPDEGLLCEPGDITGIADALQAILSSPETRTQLARAGRAKAAARFDLTANVGRLIELYATNGAGPRSMGRPARADLHPTETGA